MPKRDGGNAADLAERIGSENWATLEDVIREVFKRVGPRVLQWRVAWGIEPLIGLVVLHTCVVTAREMRLGELAEELKAAQAGEWEWAVRRSGPHGSHVDPMPDEDTARYFAASQVNAHLGYTNTVVRRRIGPWMEASE